MPEPEPRAPPPLDESFELEQTPPEPEFDDEPGPEAQAPAPPDEPVELEQTPPEPEFDDEPGSEDDVEDLGIVHGAVDEDAALAEDDDDEPTESLAATNVADEMGADSEEGALLQGEDLIEESPFVSSLAEQLESPAALSQTGTAPETPDSEPSLVSPPADQAGGAKPAPPEPPPAPEKLDTEPIIPAPSRPPVKDIWDVGPVAQPPRESAGQMDRASTPAAATPDQPRLSQPASPVQAEPERMRPARPPTRPARKKSGPKVLKGLFLIVVVAAVGVGGYYAGTGELPPQLAAIPGLNRLVGGAQTEVPADSVPALLVVQIDASDATLWIDDEFVNRRRHQLLRGQYELRVVAPGFAPYTATIALSPGDTVIHAVVLDAAAQCVSPDDAGYNSDHACFDVAPQLVGSARFAVPITDDLPRRPDSSAVLSIEVLADGTAGTVVVKNPSDVPQFAIHAVEFAKGLSYEAATKDGRAVVGWLELEFYAGRGPS